MYGNCLVAGETPKTSRIILKHMRERETKNVSNKRLAVSSYWAAATQMGAMDLHERTQVGGGQPKKGAKPPR